MSSQIAECFFEKQVQILIQPLPPPLPSALNKITWTSVSRKGNFFYVFHKFRCKISDGGSLVTIINWILRFS